MTWRPNPADLAIVEIEEVEEVIGWSIRVDEVIKQQEWARLINSVTVSVYYPGIFALFKYQVVTTSGIVETVWGVAGDLPTVYLDDPSCFDEATALDGYVGEMTAWVQAVQDGSPLNEVFPIGAAPTKENADALQSRLDFIEQWLIPDVAAIFSMGSC